MFYLPHRPVIRESAETIKLRIVRVASSKLEMFKTVKFFRSSKCEKSTVGLNFTTQKASN